MAKNISNNSPTKEVQSRFTTTWAAIIAGSTLLSMGFGSGFYISDVLCKIKINEINQSQNQQLYEQKKSFDYKIEELIHEKHLLEIENGKLRKK